MEAVVIESEVKADGGGVADKVEPQHWLDASPDYSEIAKDSDARATLAKYKTPKDQLKGHVELQRQFRNTFRVPDQLDTLEEGERVKVLGRLGKIMGAKEKAEDYEIVRPKLPNGMEYPEGREKDFRALCVKHRLPQSAVTELHDMMIGHDAKQFTAEVDGAVNMAKDASAKLEKQYGKEEWARRRDLSTRMLREWGNKAGKQYAEMLADILDIKNGDKMTAVLAAVGELAVAAHDGGVTLIPAGGAPGAEQINVAERWPNSQDVMNR
jgi:hypothetical protein